MMNTIRIASIVLAVTTLLASAPVVPAQTNDIASTNTAPTNAVPPPPSRPTVDRVAMQTQRMSTLLKLTEDQKPRVKAALEELQSTVHGLSPEERRAKRQEIQETFDAKLKAILTPEQFEHWEQLQGRRRSAGQRAPLNAGAPASDPSTNSATPPH